MNFLKKTISSVKSRVIKNKDKVISSLKKHIAWSVMWIIWVVWANNALASNFGIQETYNTDYIVQRWDTLSQIANRHAMSLDEIISINPHLAKRKNTIYVWEAINLSKYEEIVDTHIVKSWENLWRIVFNKTSDWNLANSLDRVVIHPLDEVLIWDNFIKVLRNSQEIYAKYINTKNTDTLIQRERQTKRQTVRSISSNVWNVSSWIRNFKPINDWDFELGNNTMSSWNLVWQILSNNIDNINTQYKNPWRCWANIRALLNTIWLDDIPSYWMHWYRYIDVLNNLAREWKISKVRVSNPSEAKPWAILVYNKWYWAYNSPRYKYWHVEAKTNNGYFWWGFSERHWWSITWSNSQTWFTWYAYYVNNVNFNLSTGFFKDTNKISSILSTFDTKISSNDNKRDNVVSLNNRKVSEDRSINLQNNVVQLKKTTNSRVNHIVNSNSYRIIDELRRNGKVEEEVLTSLEEKIVRDPEIVSRTIHHRIAQLETLKTKLEENSTDEIMLQRVRNNIKYFNWVLESLENSDFELKMA